MSRDPRQLPFLGAGLGWRAELADFLDEQRKHLGFVELMPEHVLDAPPDARPGILERAMRTPVITHAVSASIGSAEGPDVAFLEAMREVSDRTAAPWASDHLCFTKVGQRHLGQLVPLPYDDDALEVVIRNVKTAQRILGRPFALENVTKYFGYQGEPYSEPEFMSIVARETGCYLLLDVTNVWNNARNLGVNAERYVREFPLDRTIHLHLGGVHEDGAGGILDTHAGPVPEPVWEMTEGILREAPVRALVIERDDEFDDLAQLAGELRRAASLMEAAG